MKGLITHEESQAVTLAFRSKGYEFYSCDLQECSGGRKDLHIVSDCFRAAMAEKYEFLGMHPVCKYLTNAGVRWLASKTPKEGFEWNERHHIYINPERWKLMVQAAEHFKKCLEYVRFVGKGYVENPIMHKYAMQIIGVKHTQVVQPYMFGTMETKATCLWITGLPKLLPTNNVKEAMMKLPYKDRAKVHYATPGPEREKLRSKTEVNLAKAMADQWT